MTSPRPCLLVLLALWLGLSASPLWARSAPPEGHPPPTPFRVEEPLLQGLWVDPRTGNDFLQVERRGLSWSVTAYGGDPAHPRYLSLGQLTPQEGGEMMGLLRDQPGQCCGNQGRLSLRLVQADRLQARALWWPLGQHDPGSPLGEAYPLERVRVSKAGPQAPGPSAASPSPLPATAKARLTRSWEGAWQGEGWGRFLMAQRGRQLFILWYYGQPEGPKFHGRYQLGSDLRQAKGQALGPVEGASTYFRHELTLEADSAPQPQARLASWRLAAPLDDGRLVSFKKPQRSGAVLIKVADSLTPGRQPCSGNSWTTPTRTRPSSTSMPWTRPRATDGWSSVEPASNPGSGQGRPAPGTGPAICPALVPGQPA